MVNRTTEAQIFYSSNHHKWVHKLKIVNNVKIDLLTTEIWPTELVVRLSVSDVMSESLSGKLVREKLNF